MEWVMQLTRKGLTEVLDSSKAVIMVGMSNTPDRRAMRWGEVYGGVDQPN
jgi:predicted CoA-binding protein